LNEHQKLASLSSRSGIAGEAISMIIKTASSQTPRSDNTKPYQALYGSIQGSVYEDLRKESAKFITSLPFDGYAIGGVAVGENKKEMKQVLDWVTPYLPPDKPRHLLGVGEIDDIFTLVEHGMDTFDCVQPTRLARMGRVYTQCIHQTNPTNQTNEKMYEIDILRAEFAEDFEPIEKDCPCYTCTHFTRGYLHHLFKVRELLGYRLATIHNISFINRLVREIRLAIASDSFVALKKKWGM
jgi:tRNA-guanine transglycosylase